MCIRQQIPEALTAVRTHAERDCVPEVPDTALRVSFPCRDRRGHQEIFGMCIPMQQR